MRQRKKHSSEKRKVKGSIQRERERLLVVVDVVYSILYMMMMMKSERENRVLYLNPFFMCQHSSAFAARSACVAASSSIPLCRGTNKIKQTELLRDNFFNYRPARRALLYIMSSSSSHTARYYNFFFRSRLFFTRVERRPAALNGLLLSLLCVWGVAYMRAHCLVNRRNDLFNNNKNLIEDCGKSPAMVVFFHEAFCN